MLYDVYWSKVVSDLNTIESIRGKINFLYAEKERFVLNNQNPDADIMEKVFDNEIQKLTNQQSVGQSESDANADNLCKEPDKELIANLELNDKSLGKIMLSGNIKLFKEYEKRLISDDAIRFEATDMVYMVNKRKVELIKSVFPSTITG